MAVRRKQIALSTGGASVPQSEGVKPMSLSRRDFIKAATAIGASLAWVSTPRASRTNWKQSSEHYPQGVASAHPDPHSGILWKRHPYDEGNRHVLTVEVAEHEAFQRVVAHARAPVLGSADWT